MSFSEQQKREAVLFAIGFIEGRKLKPRPAEAERWVAILQAVEQDIANKPSEPRK